MLSEGWESFIREQQQNRSIIRKSFAVTRERLYKIRNYAKTRRIVYPECKEAFDYVHELYPSVGVKQSIVYLTTKTFLHEIGYVGIGGFYDANERVVCVTENPSSGEYDEYDIKTEFTLDEVLVHELIHYCANFKVAMANRNVEEEIAYGKSVPYLRMKGRSDTFIVEKNMLPYLMSMVDRGEVIKSVLLKHYKAENLAGISQAVIQEAIRPLSKEIKKATIEAAKDIGHRMIAIYGGGEKKEPPVKHKKLIVEDFF